MSRASAKETTTDCVFALNGVFFDYEYCLMEAMLFCFCELAVWRALLFPRAAFPRRDAGEKEGGQLSRKEDNRIPTLKLRVRLKIHQ
jgi:hypothetical protein